MKASEIKAKHNRIEQLESFARELVKAIRWYHEEGQDMKLHKKAVPSCSDCALLAKSAEVLGEK